jgi:hypothetical protein
MHRLRIKVAVTPPQIRHAFDQAEASGLRSQVEERVFKSGYDIFRYYDFPSLESAVANSGFQDSVERALSQRVLADCAIANIYRPILSRLGIGDAYISASYESPSMPSDAVDVEFERWLSIVRFRAALPRGTITWKPADLRPDREFLPGMQSGHIPSKLRGSAANSHTNGDKALALKERTAAALAQMVRTEKEAEAIYASVYPWLGSQ